MVDRRIALLVLCGACSSVAGAYELNGVSWDWQDHPFEDPVVLDVDSFPADEVDAGELEDRFTSAMEAWNESGAALELGYGGTGTADFAADGHWNVAWYDSTDEGTWGGTLAFAATWTWHDGAGNDCDIIFLSENDYGAVSWSSDPSGAASGSYDAEAVALHELGHCIGLGHSTSSDAVMYEYYGSLRELDQDDLDGAEALHGTQACVDGDGDGYSDCDADCEDDNAAVNPGASESCNGFDDNCDGVVDNAVERTVVFADEDTTSFDGGWQSLGNVFRIEAPTLLQRARMRVEAPEGARLAWTVYRSDDASDWEMLRTERAVATADEWQESPELDLPLEQGGYVEVSLGVFDEEATFWYDEAPPRGTYGPIKITGYTGSRALGDVVAEVNSGFTIEGEVTVVDLEDADADGMTESCGDCDPEDATVYEGAEELCDTLDNDCDGQTDEGFAEVDSDGDGVYDCLDDCPEDALDDSDGDGSCDSDDPCPEDPEDLCEEADSAAPDSDPADDTAPTGTPGKDEGPAGGCACSSLASGSAGGLAWLLALVWLGRRRVVDLAHR